MQNILFISREKPEKYPKIDEHYTWVGLHGDFNFEILSRYWHEHKPLAVYSYGEGIDQGALFRTFIVRKRWIHLDKLPDFINVIPCVYSGILGHHFDKHNPLMSIITTSYNSGHKLLRPLRSLMSQSYQEWEWIIWDDSENDQTYKHLLDLQKRDLRIRVFKAPLHSGYIGEMKRMAASMALGAYIVEVDHDDDLHVDMLKWIKEAGEKHPECSFFYTDCAELTEETYEPATYGDFFGMGYAVHLNVWSDFHKQYVASSIEPVPNALTLSHIVGVPNHVRAWRTEFYDKIGKHNPLLSVADDYDLILRSYIHGKWCHIRACGYYQYRNRDGNFTFHRNALIQHNTKHIYPHYMNQLPKVNNNFPIVPQWSTDIDPYPRTHVEYLPEDYRYDTVIGLIDPTNEEIDREIKAMEEKNKEKPLKYHIFVVGDVKNPSQEWVKKVSWWNLGSKNRDDRVRFIKKFLHFTGELVIR
jgi:glycosyltransferase involved in cell wall biosynthesis